MFRLVTIFDNGGNVENVDACNGGNAENVEADNGGNAENVDAVNGGNVDAANVVNAAKIKLCFLRFVFCSGKLAFQGPN